MAVLALYLVVNSSNGGFQIHRALPSANGKPGYRVSSSPGSKVEDKNVQSKHGTSHDKKTHVPHHQNAMEFQSRWTEAACYSIASCMLVGLSGIFPLIIIPLEAGPSLQHGGKCD